MFPYFCRRTARPNPRTLHQAGHKHSLLRMRLPVPVCSTCCRQAQSHNFCMNLMWNVQQYDYALDETILLTQTLIPGKWGNCHCLGNCNQWLQWVVPQLRSLKLPPLHLLTASGAKCTETLPVTFCCPASAFPARWNHRLSSFCISDTLNSRNSSVLRALLKNYCH